MSAQVEFRLLGPIEVVGADDAPIALPGGKPRLLLALLLLEAGRVVSVERLLAGLWGERPPATAAKVVLGYVSRLRKLLPPGVLETREPGYLVRVADGQLDLHRFQRLCRDANAAAAAERFQAASALLDEALALWRGPPLADVADELRLPGELARLEELRLVALEERIDAELALGHDAELVPELEALTLAYPLRERFRAQLMRVLYRLGRQADALSLYRETRESLVEELGIEPGAELQELERRILVQDETLAPAAAPDRWSSLPAPLTPLVGRVRELAEVAGLLRRPGVRLVTLVGPGGVGKTRLALAAAELQPSAALVLLAPVQEPRLLRSVIADALGVKDEATLAEWLRPRELLLVLDNFEHLLEGTPIVTDLLAAAQGLQVLATSRTPLNLTGEHRYSVGPLPESDAVDLFIERAAAADADVERADEVVDICRRLDCLPLAIELAAARAKTLPPPLLLARLEQRLALLTRGARDLPDRQRTLRATIQWSHALLDSDEQRAFARLAVFAGGCTLEAAEQVCETSLETLEGLVDKSLVYADGDRFTMLETIHEYARERLQALGESNEITRRLAERLTGTAEAFSAEADRDETPPTAPLESELGNIRATFGVVLGWQDEPLALQLAAALVSFWAASGRYGEGLKWTVQALERADNPPASTQADCFAAAARLATMVGDAPQALALGERALALVRADRDDRRQAEVLRWLAMANTLAGEGERARALHAESIAMQERLGDPLRLMRALKLAGEDELALGDAPRACALLERALDLARTGRRREFVMTSHSLGDVNLVERDLPSAVGFYLTGVADGLPGYPMDTAFSLAGLAAVAALEQRVEAAGRLWGAVESYQRQLGEMFIRPPALDRYRAALELVRGAAFDQAVRAGQELTLERAAREAIDGFDGSDRAALPAGTDRSAASGG